MNCYWQELPTLKVYGLLLFKGFSGKAKGPENIQALLLIIYLVS
jgi:hypothetical protein